MLRISIIYNFSARLLSGILFVLINLISSTNTLSSQELCLNKICSGCIAGSLSCQEGGLSHLPDRLTADIQSMILIRHNFDNPILMSANFTPYSQQDVKLQRLTLRNCGIQRLQPETFSSMESLQQLDLSQNLIKVIPKACFAGLQLDFLRLDENPNLKLAPGAFDETTIVSLSMNQCGLTSLTYDDLAPLLLNKQLTNLDLSGNQLITLESRLEVTFLQLQSLSLEQNPFNCDCRLNWLADVLLRRQVRRRTRASSQSGEESSQVIYGLSHGMIGDLDLSKNAQLDGDLMKPLCRTPRRLIGRSIETLTATDFYCGTPQLQILEVDLGRFGQQTYDDKTFSNNTNRTLEVTLRCRVKGSPELQVYWYRREYPTSEKLLRIETDHLSPNFARLANIKALSDGGMELRLERTLQSAESSTQQGVDNLLCVASDSNGNTSAEVVLHWPTIAHSLMNTLPDKESNGRTQKHLQETVNRSEQAGSLKKISSELNQGWYTIIQEERDNFLFQKQFSVLEMIGAVVGTFTVTLALFIFGCCFLRMHRHHQDKVRSKVLLHHTTSQHSYNHPSPGSENSKPPAYSSSSSRTPTSVVSTVNNHLPVSNSTAMAISLASPQPNGTHHVIDNGTLLGEFNGMHRFPFASYEPFSAPDLNSPTTYSDSQTYDLPQLPPVHCPPSVPLPPLPTAFLTTSSVAMPMNRPVGIDRTDDARVPFLVSTLPCSPLTESNRNMNGPVLSPVLINNPNSMSAAMSAAATLNRLQLQQQQQQQLSQQQQQQQHQPHVNGSISQHQLAAAAVVQNHLFDFVNRQNLLNQQYHDPQYTNNRISTYDSPQT